MAEIVTLVTNGRLARYLDMFINALTQAGILALLCLVIAVTPLFLGVAYAIRPSEGRLALMRPFSLASIFASLSGLLAGVINTLVFISAGASPLNTQIIAISVAESLVPMFVGFGCLTVAWLCVAAGLRRQP